MQTQASADHQKLSAVPLDDEVMLTSGQTRARVGNPANMTIWRWQRDPRVQFPQPDAVINGRRYWRLGTIRRWQAEQAQKQAA